MSSNTNFLDFPERTYLDRPDVNSSQGPEVHCRLWSSGVGAPWLPLGCNVTMPLPFHFPLLKSENGADFLIVFPELNKWIHIEYFIRQLKKKEKKKAAVKISSFSYNSGTNQPQAREFHFGFQTSPTDKTPQEIQELTYSASICWAPAMSGTLLEKCRRKWSHLRASPSLRWYRNVGQEGHL